MRVLAFLTDPPVVAAILLHLDPGPPRNACIAWGEGLPHKPPPLSPARGPPQSDLLTGLLDQTPALDRGPRATHVAWGEGPAEPEPIPDFEFDQSLPDDFEL